MTSGTGSARIGTSGFQYDHWRGRFYPASMPRARWFHHYSARFDTVEINNTFYQLPNAATFDRWRAQAPRDFLYALKFSRYATHIRRLRAPNEPIRRFLQRARRLGRQLGPILVQLPPRWRVRPDRLAAFFRYAPRSVRWAVEFRDASWLTEPVYEILADHNAALCWHDAIEDHPRIVTADWLYLRFHGAGRPHGYPYQRLVAEADRIRHWRAQGRDVHVYFNNDARAHAVADALALKRYLGV